MPKIGLRILKSSLAVFICFLISLLRQNSGIVFYSCIAAVLSMQQNDTNTKKVARNRIEGTFIGGIIGMFTLLFERAFIPNDMIVLQYAFISFMIIPIIYITVLLKKTSASYITCVVFMSITVSHAVDINPYLFAWNRILDTLIGIFVTFGINCVHLPYRYNKDVLFLCDFEETLLNKRKQLSSYTEIKLKQLLEKHAKIMIMSENPPTSILPYIQNIDFTMPLVCMNGASLYDIKNNQYYNNKMIDKKTVEELLLICKSLNINCFIHSILHGALHIYFNEYKNCVEESIYAPLQKANNHIYICEDFPDNGEVLYIDLIGKNELIKELLQHIQEKKLDIKLIIKNIKDNNAYTNLKIYSNVTSREQSINEFIERNEENDIFVFSNNREDIGCMKQATAAYTMNPEMKHIANQLDLNKSDVVVRKMTKLFHAHKK
ncbi:MAG: HAD hydrolase family protein [Erysipelotrichaceae bacterium]